MYIKSSYLSDALAPDTSHRIIQKLVEASKSFEFDAIAVCGYSGTLFGVALSIILGKPLIVVRKNDNDSHSGHRIEGLFPLDKEDFIRYIIVDDHVQTGLTIDYMQREIESAFQREMALCNLLKPITGPDEGKFSKCVQVILYGSNCRQDLPGIMELQ